SVGGAGPAGPPSDSRPEGFPPADRKARGQPPVQEYRPPPPPQTPQRSAPAARDKPARWPVAIASAARQTPSRDAEVSGGEGSCCPPERCVITRLLVRCPDRETLFVCAVSAAAARRGRN